MDDDVPDPLRSREFRELSWASMLAGAGTYGNPDLDKLGRPVFARERRKERAPDHAFNRFGI